MPSPPLSTADGEADLATAQHDDGAGNRPEVVIEVVAKAVGNVDHSPENLAWAEEMRAKGRENHAIATRERWEKRRAKRR